MSNGPTRGVPRGPSARLRRRRNVHRGVPRSRQARSSTAMKSASSRRRLCDRRRGSSPCRRADWRPSGGDSRGHFRPYRSAPTIQWSCLGRYSRERKQSVAALLAHWSGRHGMTKQRKLGSSFSAQVLRLAACNDPGSSSTTPSPTLPVPWPPYLPPVYTFSNVTLSALVFEENLNGQARRAS